MKLITAIWVFFVIGWIANIMQLASNLPETLSTITPFQIIKAVGIFVAPIGSLLGWIGFFV